MIGLLVVSFGITIFSYYRFFKGRSVDYDSEELHASKSQLRKLRKIHAQPATPEIKSVYCDTASINSTSIDLPDEHFFQALFSQDSPFEYTNMFCPFIEVIYELKGKTFALLAKRNDSIMCPNKEYLTGKVKQTVHLAELFNRTTNEKLNVTMYMKYLAGPYGDFHANIGHKHEHQNVFLKYPEYDHLQITMKDGKVHDIFSENKE